MVLMPHHPLLVEADLAVRFRLQVYYYRYRLPVCSRPQHPSIPDVPTNAGCVIFVESPYNILEAPLCRVVVRERGGPTDGHVLFVSPRDLIPLEDFTGWAYCHGIVASPNWINRKGQRYWLRSDLPFLKGRRSAPVANLDTNTAEEVAIRDVIWLPDKIPGKGGPYKHPEGPEPGHWITTCRGYGGSDGIEPGGRPGGNPNADLIPFPGCERRTVLREIKEIGTGRVNDMPVALTEEPPHATTEPMLRHGPLILCGCEGEYEKEPFRSVVTWIKGENDGMTEWITVEEMDACYIDVIKPDLSLLPPPPMPQLSQPW